MRPCGTTNDCNGELTGGTAICIDKGADGKFCGADCTTTNQCPTGFECTDTADGAGDLAYLGARVEEPEHRDDRDDDDGPPDDPVAS